MPATLREKVRVTMHLPEGYTKVLVEWTVGVGMADGGIYWDIPTSVIPALRLRKLSTARKSTDGTAGSINFPMLVRGDASAFPRFIFLE